MDTWELAQVHESSFWLNDNLSCANTFIEEEKQLNIYATRMKLQVADGIVMFNNKSVIDIGSGPVSMLLKGYGFTSAWAVDPLMSKFPQWVRDRYQSRGITAINATGEAVSISGKADMVLCYNVLQHVRDPELVVKNMKKLGNEIRIFEWVNVPSDEKHPHVLGAKKLDEWLGTKGITEVIDEKYTFAGATCYYAVV